MEVLKVPLEKEEEKGDEFELCLELSIGGRYAQSENSRGKTITENVNCGQHGNNNNNCGVISRSDFSCESVDDLQRRREIQALRRQEARKKREEKLKKSRGQNGNCAMVEDRLFLEAQRFRTRAEEREIREREYGFSEELARKQENINGGVNGVGNELHLCLYPKVQPNVAVDCESEQSNGMNDGGGNRKTASFERSSSTVSDYQSTSHKGGSSSDTGSHSSPPRARQHHGVSRCATDRPQRNDSSSPTEPDRDCLGGVKSNPYFNQINNNISSASSSLAKETSVGSTDKPPKPPNHNNINIAAPPLPHMPLVSATGNGPNGKTITGFLYKYTKTEVSILCVCHGTSFSPAAFVEHAGGVDVSHPLRRITIVPSAFG